MDSEKSNWTEGPKSLAKGMKPSLRGLKGSRTHWIQKTSNQTGHKCQRTSQTQLNTRTEIQTQSNHKGRDMNTNGHKARYTNMDRPQELGHNIAQGSNSFHWRSDE